MTHIAVISWWKILEGEMPYWRIAEHYVHPKGWWDKFEPVVHEVADISVSINYEYLAMLFLSVMVIGIVGMIFVEWCNSPKGFERLITPFCLRVERRYSFVRNRRNEIIFWNSVND